MPQATLHSLHERVKNDTYHNNAVNCWFKHVDSLIEGEEPSSHALRKKPDDLTIRTTCFVLGDGKVLGSPDALEARRLTAVLDEKQRTADILKKSINKIKELQN